MMAIVVCKRKANVVLASSCFCFYFLPLALFFCPATGTIKSILKQAALAITRGWFSTTAFISHPRVLLKQGQQQPAGMTSAGSSAESLCGHNGSSETGEKSADSRLFPASFIINAHKSHEELWFQCRNPGLFFSS